MDDFDARRASLDLVTAFVSNNKLSAAELPTLLSDIFKAISGFEIHTEGPVKSGNEPSKASAMPASTLAPQAKAPRTLATSVTPETVKSPAPETTPRPKALGADKPAVSVEASLADPNFIISLITGEKLKMLKRHLTKHSLTEAEYRARFSLPADYPMVARAYAELRRDVAKKMHAKGKDVEPIGAPDATPAPEISKETPKSAKAEPAPRKRVSAPKKAVSSSARPAKPRAVRSTRTNVAADITTKASEQLVQASKELAAGGAAPIPLPEPVKTAEATGKGPAPKQVKKRRMARPPAKTGAAVPTTAKEAKAQDQNPTASSKRTTNKSGKASGASATITEEAKRKPGRKERKKLSPVFG